ncbi:thioredoxin [Ruminococcaceae bacterium AM07-15]|nr:thioredoxin [Ruminococcaceae bacterium AM07-15]
MAVKHITQDQFDEVTNQQGKKVLVDFFATWCGPCKMLAPMLEELSEKLPENCEIVKIDVDQNPEAARKFRVMSIPTLILFENGQPTERMVGVHSLDEISRLF